MATAADLIVFAGTIATLNPDQPWAEALAVANGKVLAVGSRTEIEQSHRGPQTVIHELSDATIMPGLHDAHNHHQIAGKAALMEVEFLPTASLAEILDAIKDYSSRLPQDAWVVGEAGEAHSLRSFLNLKQRLSWILHQVVVRCCW